MFKIYVFKPVKFVITLFCLFNFAASAQNVNPKYSYFVDGDTPSAWQWVLSDPQNWWLPISENTGTSKSGKVSISPSDDKTFNGAVKIDWSKTPVWGGVSISGMTTNLAPFEQKGEVVLAVKLEKRGGNVNVKMNCGKNCDGSVNISDHLKKAKLNTWFALPIPLDCFSAQGADLSKINQPFSIGTDSSMILHIAEIRVTAMKAGDQGCTPN